MAKPILDSQATFMKGEKKNLALKLWDEANNALTDLSTSTATVAVYDQTNTVILAAGAATNTGTTLLGVSRLWDTTAVAPGQYKAVVAWTFGTFLQYFQWQVIVLPNPAP